MSLRRFHNSRKLARSWRLVAQRQNQELIEAQQFLKECAVWRDRAGMLAELALRVAAAVCAMLGIKPGTGRVWRLTREQMAAIGQHGIPRLDVEWRGEVGVFELMASVEEKKGLIVMQGGIH